MTHSSYFHVIQIQRLNFQHLLNLPSVEIEYQQNKEKINEQLLCQAKIVLCPPFITCSASFKEKQTEKFLSTVLLLKKSNLRSFSPQKNKKNEGHLSFTQLYCGSLDFSLPSHLAFFFPSPPLPSPLSLPFRPWTSELPLPATTKLPLLQHATTKVAATKSHRYLSAGQHFEENISSGVARAVEIPFHLTCSHSSPISTSDFVISHKQTGTPQYCIKKHDDDNQCIRMQ